MKDIIEKIEKVQVINSSYNDNINELLCEYKKLIDQKLKELKYITNKEIKLSIIDDTILKVWNEAESLSENDINRIIQELKEILLKWMKIIK